jgi:cystathionine beta-lyase
MQTKNVVDLDTELLIKDMNDLRQRAAKVWDYEPNLAISANLTHPVVQKLEIVIAEHEHARHVIALPTGQAAIATALFSLSSPGRHILLPDCVYGPVRLLALRQLKSFGLETSFYIPGDLTDIAAQIRDTTDVLYIENPGSGTFETQDVTAIAALAKQRGIKTVIDNTWQSFIYSQPLDIGIDVVLHSLSKTASCGRVFGGCLATNDSETYKKLKDMAVFLGHWLSPRDADIILSEIPSMQHRLTAKSASAVAVADFLESRAEISAILRPSIKGASLFSVALRQDITQPQIDAFVESLKCFYISHGWGGPRSYCLPTKPTRARNPAPANLVRFYIGDDHAVQEMIDDIQNAFSKAFTT